MNAPQDMRDEDGRILDGWIVKLPLASYIFHADNHLHDIIHLASVRYRKDGHGTASHSACSAFPFRYSAERPRSRHGLEPRHNSAEATRA